MQKRKLTEVAADKLIEYIRDKGMKVGDKLPNEYELTEILGAGRNTVREAVRILASRNIVDIRQGAGTFICEKTGMIEDPLGLSFMSDQRKIVEDLMQVRIIIEPEIAALAAQNATKEEIDKLEVLTRAVEKAIEEKNDFSKEDIAFHTHLAICSKNLVITNLLPVITEGVSLFAAEVSEQEYEQTKKSHRGIFEAIRDGKAIEAKQAMIYHLLFNRNRF